LTDPAGGMALNDVSGCGDDGRYVVRVAGLTALGCHGRRNGKYRDHAAPSHDAVLEHEVTYRRHYATCVQLRLVINAHNNSLTIITTARIYS